MIPLLLTAGIGLVILMSSSKKPRPSDIPASLVTEDDAKEEEEILKQNPDVFKDTVFASFKKPALPAGYRYARQGEVPRALLDGIRSHLSRELGSVVFEEHAGQKFANVIEPHYHPPGGPSKPWGPHKGVSVYIHDDSKPA